MIIKLSLAKFIWWLFLVVLVFGLSSQLKLTFAQELNSAAAKKYDVIFPIAELGNCTDYSTCRTFCEDPVHKDACVGFAKVKGFYKEDAATIQANSIVDAAKVELGCNSFDSCQTFCQDDQNKDKCDAFAKSHKLNGGRVDNPAKQEIIKKAKELLGCDAEDSCKSFCSNSVNVQKCSDFARSTGLRGGEFRKGPGGCSSEGSCRSFCLDPKNFNECSKFGGGQKGAEGGFRGPGGCNNKDACESYCQSHPKECSQITQNQTAPVDAKEFVDFCKSNSDKCFYNRYCEENPAKCQKDFSSGGVGQARADMGNCKTPGECYDYCRANLGKCQGFNPEAGRPDDSQYRAYTETNYDPAAACKKGGCNWSNNSCQCASSGYNYQQAYPAYTQSTMSRESQEATCRSGGGTCGWNGDTCYCQGYRSPTSGSSGTNYPVPTNYSSSNTGGTNMSREQQESGCRSVGGTCDWSSGVCNCRGYSSSGSTSGSSGSTPTPTPGTTSSSGSNMSREQQESGCRSCNGSCNWSGDNCQCQCGSTSTSTTATQPPQPQPSPAVQGVSTQKSFWQQIMDWLNNL